MTHPITTKIFKVKLKDLISNNPRVSNNERLKEKLKNTVYVTGLHPSTPKKLEEKIKDFGEKAMQRGICYEESILLDYGGLKPIEIINWIDIEVPVVLNKNSRRFCLDIVGSNDNKLVLCELKYSKKNANPTEHPIYAVYELLVYYYFVRCNFEKLDKHKVYRPLAIQKAFNWEKYLKYSTPQLLVTANASYWAHWFKRNNYKDELLKEISKLEKVLQIEIQLFKTEDEDFSVQNSDNLPYKPKITSKIWTKI